MCGSQNAFALIVGIGVGFLAWLFSGPQEEEPRRASSDYGYRNNERNFSYECGRSYGVSNPRNNHDHQKKRHATREDAELEVFRMKLLGVEGCERLNVYKNEQLDSWFVGRSKW